jgi:MATE family multidrug resistance protein
MIVNVIGAVVNIPLDYCMINGIGPFPELGIIGAGIATVIASATTTAVLLILIFRKANRERFSTWKARALDRELFGRMMRYGVPSGVQFFLEIFGFTFFIQMLGRLGDLELAASNIVLSIESLSFLPMVGFHIGNATLMGQAIGRRRPEEGAYATTSSVHITMVYMMFLAVIYVLAPEPLLLLFRSVRYTPTEYAEIMTLGIVLLRFVAAFSFFDALNLIFSSAIKGAGDTRFIMWTIAALCLCVMIIPIYVAIEVMGAGIYAAWMIATVYVCALGMAFMLRYRQGKWKRMRVIESQPLGQEQGCPSPTLANTSAFSLLVRRSGSSRANPPGAGKPQNVEHRRTNTEVNNRRNQTPSFEIRYSIFDIPACHRIWLLCPMPSRQPSSSARATSGAWVLN